MNIQHRAGHLRVSPTYLIFYPLFRREIILPLPFPILHGTLVCHQHPRCLGVGVGS